MEIKDYGIIGDTNTVALVGKNGSIDWCCMPRFDSPSIFAALLDAKKGGCFRIEPMGAYASHQEYVPKTNVLKTVFKTKEGVAELIDFMPLGFDLERESVVSYSEIHRMLLCKKGQMTFQLIFEPKFKYGLEEADIVVNTDSIVAASLKRVLSVVGNIDFNQRTFSMKKDQKKLFVLYSGSVLHRSIAYFNSQDKFLLTCNYWKTWLNKCTYSGCYKDAIERSLLAIKLLSYGPEGSFVAAPTTSLPESIGGSRNWDYRFTWIRDAVFSLQALYMLGYRTEARKFVKWINHLCLRDGIGLQIMYGLGGERNLVERVLEHLDGYQGSKPVRIGNAAYKQFQLDIYGEIFDLFYMYMFYNDSIDRNIRITLINLLEFVCQNWEVPDSGLWELRNTKKQFTYSHLMCWVALDRGIKIAKTLCWNVDTKRWVKLRDKIKETILRDCFNSKLNSFTQARHDTVLDASSLLIPLYGLLPFDDPKVLGTMRAIGKRLLKNNLVYRYESDEIQEPEGAFLLATFWYIICLHKSGQQALAKKNLAQVISLSNKLGLYSEEMDPETGTYLGNYPQAFSHIGLINCILALEKDSAV